jgi:hypothetical protein
MLRRLAAVELSLAPGRAERMAVLEGYWARARELEAIIKERLLAGVPTYTFVDYWEARGERLLAEAGLAEARAGKE